MMTGNLIRCLSVQLHPEFDDKPSCASTDGPAVQGFVVSETGKGIIVRSWVLPMHGAFFDAWFPVSGFI